MKTFFRLLTLFMAMPVVELALLLQMSRWTGYWPTFALIIVTAVAGSYMAKREGLSAWNRLQSRFSEGGLPGDELLDAVIILIAGAFLITPGVLTDVIGFAGLIPLTRGWIRRLTKRRLKKAMREGRLQASFGFGGTFGGGPFGDAPPEDEAFGPAGSPGSAAPGSASPVDGQAHVGGTPSQQGPATRNDERSSDEYSSDDANGNSAADAAESDASPFAPERSPTERSLPPGPDADESTRTSSPGERA